MADDHTLRLQTSGPTAWQSIDGLSASRVDPYITGLSEDRANYLVENWPFEHVDPDEIDTEDTVSEQIEDILSGTLGDLDDALATGAYDTMLDRLASYEREHKDREGAYERIADRREDRRDETDEDRDMSEDES